MLGFVKDLNGLVSNMREYQSAVKGTSTRISPLLVRAWYFVPALDMVAASRFIGYQEMNGEKYDNSGISGSETEAYLRYKGWFRQIENDDPLYPHALELVNLFCSGGINPKARISVLREEYDQKVRRDIVIRKGQFGLISPNIEGTGKIIDERKGGIHETEITKSGEFGYSVKTKGETKKAREIEKRLLHEYQSWLGKKNRHLVSKKCDMLQCDAWETDRSNLIEAKASSSRENIRMAVGQLLDYSFQFKSICEQPHKAILLPKKPGNDRISWLEPLDIKIVWRKGRFFRDNADGQFT